MLHAAGVRIEKVQRFMHHKDIRRTINLYLDLGLSDLAEDTEKMPEVFAPTTGRGGSKKRCSETTYGKRECMGLNRSRQDDTVTDYFSMTYGAAFSTHRVSTCPILEPELEPMTGGDGVGLTSRPGINPPMDCCSDYTGTLPPR
jgi:hypothetical protein